MTEPASPTPVTYTLTNDATGEKIIFPEIVTTEGLRGIDESALRAKFGREVFDPSLGNTSIGKSEITFIDGDKGELRYRGYDIRELAEKSTFLEVAYLLRAGELPNAEQLAAFEGEISSNLRVPSSAISVINDLYEVDPNTDPMVALQAATLALSAHLSDKNAHLLIAKMPTLVAAVIQISQGKDLVVPSGHLTYTENFLNMTGQDPNNEVLNKALDRMLILHADHEQNASTTAVRNTRSTHATKVVSTANAIGALGGPLHGGANVAVMKQLAEIGTVDNIEATLTNAAGNADRFLVMGFGHRVYKSYDPRAAVLKGSVDAMLADLKVDDPRLPVAKALEERMLADPEFVRKRLFPNVDFYSGIAYSAMGFPDNTFTTLFALGRTPGWVAHMEEVDRNKEKIVRPRQSYVGYRERTYVHMDNRSVGHNGPSADAPATLDA